MKGKFIAIEGPDGTGKSTLIEALKKIFLEKSIPAKFTREPGGTRIGEKIRDLLLDISNSEMTCYTEAYLYAAARLQHVEEFIIPNLNNGYNVITDRFAMASVCYQGYGRKQNVELIKKVNALAVEMIGDLNYIVLMASPEEGLLRKKGQRVLDRLELETLDFHERVYDGYKKMISETSAHVVDASMSPEKTLEQVLKIIKKLGIN